MAILGLLDVDISDKGLKITLLDNGVLQKSHHWVTWFKTCYYTPKSQKYWLNLSHGQTWRDNLLILRTR